MTKVVSIFHGAALAVVLAVASASSAAIAAEPAPAATSAVAPIPANIAQLESLFRHLDKVGAGRIDEFQANPRAYLVKYGPLWVGTSRSRIVRQGCSLVAACLRLI